MGLDLNLSQPAQNQLLQDRDGTSTLRIKDQVAETWEELFDGKFVRDDDHAHHRNGEETFGWTVRCKPAVR